MTVGRPVTARGTKYLATGEEVTKPMDDPAVVRERITTALDAIGTDAFDPTPGVWCRHCDFRSFCDAGKAWLAADTSRA